MTTSRGITDTKVYDTQGVIDRYGIPPPLVPDFIGLKGDTSDNIPGVPGIGDKTASELLQRFGSLENVLDHIDEISGAKRKENLTAPRAGRPHLQTARDRQARHTAGPRPGGIRRAGAGPFEAARHLSAVRAARPVTPAGGGPGLRRRRGAATGIASRWRRGQRSPPRRSTLTISRASERRGRGRAASARHAGGRAVRRRRMAFRGSRQGRRRGCRRRLRGAGGAGGGARPAAGDRARRQIAWSGTRAACARHRGRRLPARAGPTRVPIQGTDGGAWVRHFGRIGSRPPTPRRRCRRGARPRTGRLAAEKSAAAG